ncbi:hypothetical protein GCM10009836_67750 [Pseudonocardia ailaonensis]|uniref:SGNH hydrolase-type esterase domain-containing protein n=1 Tax=Pseudonocardia ailaonensis TaxID=367279 RepID=A0ABN2NN61_9PSEU
MGARLAGLLGRVRMLRFGVATLVTAGLVLAAVPAGGEELVGVRTAAEGASPTAQLRVMPLGASSTEGIGSPDTAGYRLPLFRDLAADGVRVNFVGSLRSGPASLPDRDNEGHSGWTLEGMVPYVGGWVRAADPDVVLLHMGTNDIGSGATGQVAAGRLDALLDEIFDAAPQTHVVVAGIWAKMPQRAAARAELARLTPGVIARHRVLGHSVEFVDTSDLLASPTDFSDGLHANAGGYAKIARMWTGRVEGWLSAQRPVPAQAALTR